MSNTISQLYRGELEPKKYIGNGNIELKRTEILIKNNFDRLKETLNENEMKILEKYSGLIDEYVFLCQNKHFVMVFVWVCEFLQRQQEVHKFEFVGMIGIPPSVTCGDTFPSRGQAILGSTLEGELANA